MSIYDRVARAVVRNAERVNYGPDVDLGQARQHRAMARHGAALRAMIAPWRDRWRILTHPDPFGKPQVSAKK